MPKRTTPIRHADRYAQLPDAFLKYLRLHLRGFRRETVPVQLALMGMIMQAPTKFREHVAQENWASFHYKELDRKFGRGKFGKINQRLGLFDVLKDELGREAWSKVEGRTKSYRLTDAVTDLRTKFLAGVTRRKTNLLSEDGEIMRTQPKQAVNAKRTTKEGLRVTRAGWHGKPVNTAVPVNQEMLKRLMLVIEAYQYRQQFGFQGGLFHPEPDPQYLAELRAEVQLIFHLSTDLANPGFVVHRYAESPSGRLFANGTNLQNAYRPVRQAALHGMFDYDIENCHFAILSQMAQTHGYQAQAVKFYLDNKTPVRRGLAEKYGVSLKQVKLALIALVYGATFSERPKDALPRILGGILKAREFYADSMFLALQEDVKAARSAILKGHPVNRQKLKNLRGLVMDMRENAPRQQLAHLLQGVESVALESAHDLYADQVVLLQHDGFTATDLLDTKAIE